MRRVAKLLLPLLLFAVAWSAVGQTAPARRQSLQFTMYPGRVGAGLEVQCGGNSSGIRGPYICSISESGGTVTVTYQDASSVMQTLNFNIAGTGTGDITAVNTGATSGLTGGATSGDVSLALDFERLTTHGTVTWSDSGDLIPMFNDDDGGTIAVTLGQFRTEMDIPVDPATWAQASGASGQAPVARLGTGTPSTTTFLRGDGSWQTPPGGGSNDGVADSVDLGLSGQDLSITVGRTVGADLTDTVTLPSGGTGVSFTTGTSFPGSPSANDLFGFNAAATGLTSTVDYDGTTAITTAARGDVFKYDGNDSEWVKQSPGFVLSDADPVELDGSGSEPGTGADASRHDHEHELRVDGLDIVVQSIEARHIIDGLRRELPDYLFGSSTSFSNQDIGGTTHRAVNLDAPGSNASSQGDVALFQWDDSATVDADTPLAARFDGETALPIRVRDLSSGAFRTVTRGEIAEDDALYILRVQGTQWQLIAGLQRRGIAQHLLPRNPADNQIAQWDAPNSVWEAVDPPAGGTGVNDGVVSGGSYASGTITLTRTESLADVSITGIPQGDITGVTAGTGLSGGGTSGTVSLAVANPFEAADETKLDGIAAGAEVNVQANWNETSTSDDSFIQNKPTARLLPASPNDNQIAQYDAGNSVWEAVDLPTGGTADGVANSLDVGVSGTTLTVTIGRSVGANLSDTATLPSGSGTSFTTGASFPATPSNDDLFGFNAAATGLTGTVDYDGSTAITTAARGDVFKYDNANTQWVKQIPGFVLSDAVPADVDGTTDSAGTAATASRSDHVHEIGDDEVVQANMADNSIDSGQYVDGSIDPAHLNTSANWTLATGGDETALTVTATSADNAAIMRINSGTTGDQKAFQAGRSGESIAWASFEGSLGGDNTEPGLALGPGGSSARDVNLYRGGANILETDDTFRASVLAVSGTLATTQSNLGIVANAEQNVQADWTETTTTSDAFIRNKPTFTDTTLTQEQVEDYVGAMATGGTQTNITVTYADNDANAGFLNFAASGGGMGTADGVVSGGSYSAGTITLTRTESLANVEIHNVPQGDITGVTAGTGLSDGGTTGTVTLNVSNPFEAADETKLDGIATGAEVNVQADWNETDTSDDSYIQNKPTIGSGDITGVAAGTGLTGGGTSGDVTLNVANPFTDADETKLDGIATSAEVNVQANWNETDTSNDAFIRNKPTIPTLTYASANPQAVDDGASAGSANNVSRGDHQHAYGFSDVVANIPEFINLSTRAYGTSAWASRADHEHGLGTDLRSRLLPTTGSSGDLLGRGASSWDTVVAGGVARLLPTGASDGDIAKYNGSAWEAVSGVGALSDADPAAVGGTAAAEGTGTAASRSDHVHQLGFSDVPANLAVNLNLASRAYGTSAWAARADHQHYIGNDALGRLLPTGATDNQIAQYDSANSRWDAVDLPTGGTADGVANTVDLALSNQDLTITIGRSVGANLTDTVTLPTGNTTALSDDDPLALAAAAAEGTGTEASRDDHVHPATAPTPAAGDSDTSVATTAFVTNYAGEAFNAMGFNAATRRLYWSSLNSNTGELFLSILREYKGNDPTGQHTFGYGDYVRIGGTFYMSNAQSVTVTDPSTIPNNANFRAMAFLDNPVFTGDPRAPTPDQADSDTSIATTAFVQGLIAGLQAQIDALAARVTALEGGVTPPQDHTNRAAISADTSLEMSEYDAGTSSTTADITIPTWDSGSRYVFLCVPEDEADITAISQGGINQFMAFQRVSGTLFSHKCWRSITAQDSVASGITFTITQ